MMNPVPGPNKPPIRGTFGTRGDDYSLYGTREDDTISGLGGDDEIFGYAGNDWLYGGDGQDSLNGGDNNDHLYGEGGSDELFGDAGNDWLYGGDGADLLMGGADDDHLYAGDEKGNAGNILVGGAGADVLHGSPGSGDCAHYIDSPGAVEVNLGTSKGAGSDAEGDIYYDIENVTGSSFDDILIGSGDINELNGYWGDDQLFGLGGDDRLAGGMGADYLDGGDGYDRIDYRESFWQGVIVNLTTNTGSGGDAQGDTYFSIEDVFGSYYDDTIIGNSSANTFIGFDGIDTLFGGDGQDILYGGKGQDTLTGGADADTFGFFAADTIGEPPDYIMDFSQADGDVIDLHQFESSIEPQWYIETQSFSFISTAEFSGTAWQLRYEQVSGDTIISGDTDGDGQSDFAIHCIGMIDFNANDFLL
jgi:serralysin